MPEENKITEPIINDNDSPATETAKKNGANFNLANTFKGNHQLKSKNNNDQISKIINYIYPLTILIIIIGITWFVYFLYNNVYQTMTKAEIVSRLKASVSDVSLEKKKFDEIIENIRVKTSPTTKPRSTKIPNPFEYGENSSQPATSTPPATSTQTIIPNSTSTNFNQATSTN